MNKLHALKLINIGERVAEQEAEGLKEYFLKTYLWEQILSKDVDVIFGCKGSGKSALYNALSAASYDLLDTRTLVTLAENPRGTIAFKDLNTTPPTGEFEFKSIWKLYFVLLITQKLQEFDYSDKDFELVVEKLQESDLIPRRLTFSSLVKMVRDYIRKIHPSLEPNVSFYESSGMVEKVGVKISLTEPNIKQTDKGIVSVDHLLELLNESLKKSKDKIWIAIDRLDAIFQENFELEASALRTLFQVYIDFLAYDNIRLIIFLRDDIWNRIIENGFRETSHITKTDLIKWDENTLYELLMSRFRSNDFLFNYFNLRRSNPAKEHDQLFAKIFPKEMANGTKLTFPWLISRIEDGHSNAVPRELIQLVNSAIKHEVNFVLQDSKQFVSLLSKESIYAGIKDTSKTKIDTIVAEYPQTKPFIYRLKNSKVRLSVDELRIIWECSKKDAKIVSSNLIKIGFFKNESTSETNPALYIPLIYRPGLGFPLQ